MLFVDYTNQVLQDYQKKLAAGKLPSNLSQPTPARLRDECLIVFKERFTKKDERILRDFFGPPGENGYEWIIENWNIGKLKAVINFLNNPAIKTDEKNIELLAWLVDFEPRPLDQWKKIGKQPVEEPTEKPEEAPIEKEEVKGSGSRALKVVEGAMATATPPGVEKESLSTKECPEPRLKPVLPLSAKRTVNRKTLGGLLAVITLAATGVIMYQGNNSNGMSMLTSSPLTQNGECMYWAGDHYEPVPCNRKIDDAEVKPIDTILVRRFKKITRPDTITENDIGRVWYAKINKQLEFYTVYGPHPTKPQLRLKPITGYIIDKYIQKNQAAE